MKLNTKYSIGDKVWEINLSREQKKRLCSFCDGSGRILGKDRTSKRCPECHGFGSKSFWIDEAWHVFRNGTVGLVRGELRVDNGGERTANTEYMLYQHGIGSGAIFHENRLFPSEREAQAECDKRNAKEAT